MRISAIICILLLTSGPQGFSQITEGTRAFSLAEAQSHALQHNPNVQNAKLDVDAARQRIWENTAAGLPQVSASAGYTNNLQLMTTLIPAEFFGGEPGTFTPVPEPYVTPILVKPSPPAQDCAPPT